jgi:hypothetical protein
MELNNKNNGLRGDHSITAKADTDSLGEGERSMREISPFGLRMPEGLRAKVEREARINGRSLNSEINERLKRSLAGTEQLAANQTPRDYQIDMTDSERIMLRLFQKLSPEKQLALISLFK